eukprot:644517-Pyramimonas_sp.AAC.1
MLCEGRAQDKVEAAGEGEGLVLWRLPMAGCEPKYRSQTTGLMQKVATFAFATDVPASFDAFEKFVKQHQKASRRKVDEAVKMGAAIDGLAGV